MKLPTNIFTKHPASIGESYLQHLHAAGRFGLEMIVGGLACLIHALIPALFEKTGSDAIAALYQRMVVKRRARLPGEPE